jgi:hypothetical protein
MSRLQSFVAELLEREGALVQATDPDGMEVLSPPALQDTLGLPELSRLGFGPQLPAGAERVSLESDWMERLADLVAERGRWVRRVLEMSNPSPGHPERVLEHGLVLSNATFRLRGVRPAWTRYLIASFRYTAMSDEQRHGILRVGFNLANGATLDGMLDELLAEVGKKQSGSDELPPGLELPANWGRQQQTQFLRRTLPQRVGRELEPFTSSMRRRLERDLDRLFEYHDDLRREALERIAKAAGSNNPGDKPARERLRLQAVAGEYQAKVNDLRDKYAMKVELSWIQTLELVMPVRRFELLVKRRKGERLLSLDWNPAVRRLEQAPCEYSYTWERPREVCDEALHLVHPSANGPCAHCAKVYCRACHPLKCPRCGKRVAELGPGLGARRLASAQLELSAVPNSRSCDDR